MSKNWVEDIAFMHKKYGVGKWVATASPYDLKKFIDFRLDFIEEEFEETQKAHFEEDAEELVDGLIDICVVAIGTLEAMGVDANKAWNQVFYANMLKQVGVKPERPNPLGLPDLIKPKGWKAPSHADNHGNISKSFSTLKIEETSSNVVTGWNIASTSSWPADAVSHVSIDSVDFTKDSEYIKMMGDMNGNGQK